MCIAMPHPLPKNLIDAVTYFKAPGVAQAFFTNVRWPDGNVTCPRCGAANPRCYAAYGRWECRVKHERRQFTVKVGTVMEDSPLGLDKWAVAFWLEVNAKNSISSYELHRSLGITQKSAWFMLHRIRLSLHEGTFDRPFTGKVGADGTFIGGKARNMHKHKRAEKVTGTGMAGKTAVTGLLERHREKGKSRVRTKVLTDAKRKTIQPVVRANVARGSELYTDALASYAGLSPEFVHQFIDHAETHARGSVHTNGLENFWALFKRRIKGTHVSVEPYHLFRYLDAECVRFNDRSENDRGRFLLAVLGMSGKRLTYKDLTGKLLPDGYPGSGKAVENGGGGLPN